MKWYLLLSVLVPIPASALTCPDWYGHPQGCWRHIVDVNGAPCNVVNEFNLVFPTTVRFVTPAGKTALTGEQQCEKAQLIALTKATKWAEKCCYAVQTVKGKQSCQNEDPELRGLRAFQNPKIEYAMYHFDQQETKPPTLKCEQKQLDIRMVTVRAVCYNAKFSGGKPNKGCGSDYVEVSQRF